MQIEMCTAFCDCVDANLRMFTVYVSLFLRLLKLRNIVEGQTSNRDAVLRNTTAVYEIKGRTEHQQSTGLTDNRNYGGGGQNNKNTLRSTVIALQ